MCVHVMGGGWGGWTDDGRMAEREKNLKMQGSQYFHNVSHSQGK